MYKSEGRDEITSRAMWKATIHTMRFADIDSIKLMPSLTNMKFVLMERSIIISITIVLFHSGLALVVYSMISYTCHIHIIYSISYTCSESIGLAIYRRQLLLDAIKFLMLAIPNYRYRWHFRFDASNDFVTLNILICQTIYY